MYIVGVVIKIASGENFLNKIQLTSFKASFINEN